MRNRDVAGLGGANGSVLRSHGSWRIASLLFGGCEASCAVQLVLLGVLAEPRCPERVGLAQRSDGQARPLPLSRRGRFRRGSPCGVR